MIVKQVVMLLFDDGDDALLGRWSVPTRALRNTNTMVIERALSKIASYTLRGTCWSGAASCAQRADGRQTSPSSSNMAKQFFIVVSPCSTQESRVSCFILRIDIDKDRARSHNVIQSITASKESQRASSVVVMKDRVE
jgi:hypothetical protein